MSKLREIIKDIFNAGVLEERQQLDFHTNFYTTAIEAEAQILQWIDETIGEDTRPFWDNEMGLCDVCEFQPTDDTKNCLCVYRNRFRSELRQKFGINHE